MAFNYAAAELAPGKTITVRLDQLPGKPVVQLEHLGETNRTWLDDQLAKANTQQASKSSKARGKVSKRKLAESLAAARDLLAAHSVRDLVAKHADGKPATTADIPDWCAAIPADIVWLLVEIAADPESFREAFDDVDAIAEK